MRINSRKQLKLGETYYYAEYHNPNLEGQTDCVVVMKCVFDDYSKEREAKYGFANKKEIFLKTTDIVAWAGRNKPYNYQTYMEVSWVEGDQKIFYTTVNEACRDAIKYAFSRYEQYKKT